MTAVLRAQTDAWTVVEPQPPLLRLPDRDLQSFAAPDALHALGVDQPRRHGAGGADEGLRLLVHVDALIGIANRPGFEHALAEACREATAPDLDGFAALLCDLDGFKAVNAPRAAVRSSSTADRIPRFALIERHEQAIARITR